MASSPVDNELAYRTASELARELAQKRVSAVELVDAAIARIEALDGKINAVVVRDFERARAVAQAADSALARGERQPLLGLPITVKEQYNVAGLPTTWGDPQFRDWHPEDDALVVARLKAAGAIVLGKTNVPPALMDWQSENTIYGTTNNPWNLALTPGGSSGGSAAALAAGFVALELGSDIGGSLRCPAHFCGVYAHKPSLDTWCRRGARGRQRRRPCRCAAISPCWGRWRGVPATWRWRSMSWPGRTRGPRASATGSPYRRRATTASPIIACCCSTRTRCARPRPPSQHRSTG
jgi:amidase